MKLRKETEICRFKSFIPNQGMQIFESFFSIQDGIKAGKVGKYCVFMLWLSLKLCFNSVCGYVKLCLEVIVVFT